MSEHVSAEVSDLVEQIVGEVSAELTHGLTPQQAEWAVLAYRQTILPYRLAGADGESPERRSERAAMVAGAIRQTVALRPPEEKWTLIRQAYYLARLDPLSDASFTLAKEAYHGNREHGLIVEDARRVTGQIESLLAEVVEHAPDVRASVEPPAQPALQDARFAAEGGEPLSARLRLFVEDEEGKKRAAAAAAQQQTIPGWRPTHVVPEGGLPAWVEPDPEAQPVATLGAGLPVLVEQFLGAWAHVLCSNGWRGWVDGRLLRDLH